MEEVSSGEEEPLGSVGVEGGLLRGADRDLESLGLAVGHEEDLRAHTDSLSILDSLRREDDVTGDPPRNVLGSLVDVEGLGGHSDDLLS